MGIFEPIGAGAENAGINDTPLVEGLLVGPAMGFVGSLASDKVTVKL